jgi:cytosine/adenosine deaminase-related metal-dependent hydrolase
VAGLLDRIAALDVSLATTAPASRPVPSVAACRERGIAICAGNDGIRDTWTPYGNACMLERGMLVGLRNNFRADIEVTWALDTCASEGARVMGLEGYGLSEGCRADLVLVDVEAVSEAITLRPPRRLVLSGGQIVARSGETEAAWQAA